MKIRKERVREAYICHNFNDEEYANEAMLALEGLLGSDAKKDAKGMHIDITSEAVLRDDSRIYGIIKAKADGILAGLSEVLALYDAHNIKSKALKKDGDELQKGDIIAELEASERDFLKAERTGLNMLQRMSGIATATRKLADIAEKSGAYIVGTRKIIFRYLDKKAMLVGGGLTHRMGLDDAVLIKDNHLAAIKAEGIKDAIGTAIERAYTTSYQWMPKFIEIEVSSLEDAVKAVEKYKEIHSRIAEGDYTKPENYTISLVPFVIMFDNMKPSDIKKTVKALKKRGLYDYALLEASGGINESNIKAYAASGADVLSVGAVTHSVKALDISQKIVKREV